jgi:hypothetical protein
MPETIGGGGAFIDFDNDGWMDVLLVNGDWWPGHPLTGRRPTMGLFRNRHDGTFTDVTKEAGLAVPMQGMGVAVGDYDNDGWDDLYITGVGGNRLFHNDRNGRFSDVTSSAGVGDSGWSTSCAWLDYDNDGLLDLFVCHYVKWTVATDVYCGAAERVYCRPQEYPGESCRLFHNLGHGKFRDVTLAAGVYNQNSKALGVTICDLNGDGRPDIVVANDMEPNFAYINSGGGKFRETALECGLALDDLGQPRGGMGIDATVAANDGVPDVAIGNFYSQGVALFRQSPDGGFLDSAKPAGLYNSTYPFVTFGLFFTDLNNDGLPDLFITNGHIYDNVAVMDPSQSYAQPCQLFLGSGRSFADDSREAGLAVTRPVVGRGACWGDFDNDGRVDILLIPNTGSLHLLHNELHNDAYWIGIRLEGTASNRNGFGALVKVHSAGETQIQYAHDGSSYLSDSDHRLHFGLGAATGVDFISVRWPSGRVEEWRSPRIDSLVTLREGAGQRVEK